MAPFHLETCARPNILSLEPYRCARDDYQDDGHMILLDANENAHGPALPDADSLADLALHRYPDPHQRPLKQQLCALRNTHAHTPAVLTPDHLFVGVGSDEAIDALLRCFCVPSRDRILTCPPTYGMYSVAAHVHDVAVQTVPLRPAPGFNLYVPALLEALDADAATVRAAGPDVARIKLLYLCSPGNPTGSLLAKADIERLLAHPNWNGIVVLDEAYIDFASSPDDASLAELVAVYPNLVVMQTLSKAFGMAGIRLGAAFAAPPVARLLNSLKAPYNVPSTTAALAMRALRPDALARMRTHRESLLAQRDRLLRELPAIDGVGRLRGGTDANFLLFELLGKGGLPDNATALAVHRGLAEVQGVVVRFRGKEHGCQGCLRVTVGTEAENSRLLEALRAQLQELRKIPLPNGAAEEKAESEASKVVA